MVRFDALQVATALCDFWVRLLATSDIEVSTIKIYADRNLRRSLQNLYEFHYSGAFCRMRLLDLKRANANRLAGDFLRVCGPTPPLVAEDFRFVFFHLLALPIGLNIYHYRLLRAKANAVLVLAPFGANLGSSQVQPDIQAKERGCVVGPIKQPMNGTSCGAKNLIGNLEKDIRECPEFHFQ